MSIVCGRRSSETADEAAGGVWGYIYTRTATLGDMAWGGRSRPRCAVGLGEGQGAACGMKGDEGGRHGSVRVAGDVYRDEVYAASVRYVLPVSSRLRVMTILPRHVRVCMYCIRPV